MARYPACGLRSNIVLSAFSAAKCKAIKVIATGNGVLASEDKHSRQDTESVLQMALPHQIAELRTDNRLTSSVNQQHIDVAALS